MSKPLIAACAAVAVTCVLAGPARAQTPQQVLLVINERSADSVRIGEYYAQRRGVPADQIVRLTAPTDDAVSRAQYGAEIESPIVKWLARHGLQDRILYVVLTKGVPLRIHGTVGRDGTIASVDSELTLLYRRMTGAAVSTLGRIDNPLFLGERELTDARRFSRTDHDIYLVTRLDGFTADDAIALIDRAAAPSSQGRIVLDQRVLAIDRIGDRFLTEAATRLETVAKGRALLEDTRALATTTEPVLGYYSWGSNDPANKGRRLGVTFVPGAIGGLFVSTDGRTFAEPPEQWTPMMSARLPNVSPMFGPGTQSLAGDLIREGITGVVAHVAEPYLDATVRPQVLFPAYLSGFNLAESFYLSMPFLSWQTIVIGDPLCAPFSREPVPADALAIPIDPETDLPARFAERRLAILLKSGFNPQALRLSMKAEVREAHEDWAGVAALLREALALEPRYTAARFRLGDLFERQRDYEAAIGVYRDWLAAEPKNPLAMNNLAFALAERRGDLKEALPLAERAFEIARNPQIADTLGWIHTLSGQYQQALPLLEFASTNSPGNVEILIHLAYAYLGIGDKPRAQRALAIADKIDPQLDEHQPRAAPLRAKLK